MSTQRYDILHPKMRDKGRFVFYADHIADKAADIHNLLSTLSDIRAALGVGEKPMMSELAGIVRTREADHAAEVERLTAERDAAVQERDAAWAALKIALRNIQHCEYESQKRGWPRMIEVLEIDNTTLAKINGGR